MSGEREWSFNNKVVTSAVRYLEGYGIDVLRLDDPTGKTDVPLTTRTNKANNWGADILVSYHHNANNGRWGNWTGTETYYYPGASTGLALAKAIHPSIVGVMGLRDRGIKTANLHMVRESRMPAILIEVGFMDSTIDIKVMRDDDKLERAGKALADAIANYFGVKGQSKPSKPESKSISKMAQEVIAGKHGNGHDARRKSLGITQAEYDKVRKEVNRRSGIKTASKSKGKTVAQMAQEVIDGKHGNGHANRRKSLGVSSSVYNKVKREVNRRLTGKSIASSMPKPKSFSVGQKVTVKKSASKFATGESIADFVKGNSYTVKQVKSDRVLLSGIMSWVRKSDVY
nr:N-acetylmuramoyl-L-alanine amidase [Virgibacillus sp. Bac330]